jgi:hypothetical protein
MKRKIRRAMKRASLPVSAKIRKAMKFWEQESALMRAAAADSRTLVDRFIASSLVVGMRLLPCMPVRKEIEIVRG